jgi:predicted permease
MTVSHANILGMTAIGGGVALILAGKDGYGLAAIITALGALLTSFFGGAFLRKKERENKVK